MPVVVANAPRVDSILSFSKTSRTAEHCLIPKNPNGELISLPEQVLKSNPTPEFTMAATHSQQFLEQVPKVAQAIDHQTIERIAVGLADLRSRGGRLFVLGVGGGASNSSHAVCDFRKLTGIEAYTPSDNISELTARTNDEGWSTVFEAWLKTSNANEKDAVMVFSVGGGDAERNVSANIVRALDEAKRRGLAIYGIVGRDGGHTKKVGDEVIVIPTVDAEFVTAHTESFQAVIWHCLVFHPSLKIQASKWEGLSNDEEDL